ncbi:unnamed protein product [Closterium sp. Yama58-4]|nr:unnamed protein product [Closterium sp. Yama58-4]
MTHINGSTNQPIELNDSVPIPADFSAGSAVSPATQARRRFIEDKGAGDNVAAERAEMLARVLAPSGDCLPRIKLGAALGAGEASAGWAGAEGATRANTTQPIRRAQRRSLTPNGGESSFPLSVASATTFVAACVVAAGAAFARHKSLPTPPAASVSAMVAPASLPVKDQVLGHYAVEEAPQSDLRPVLGDGSVQLRTAAARSFLSMQDAARRDGIFLTPLSGFRSVRDQQSVFYGVKAARNQNIRQRAKVSAPPGFSEHHTGYALDIGDANSPATHLEFDFENTEAFYWLQKNANRFHFELSFPPDNTRGIIMASLICFPFKEEDVTVAVRNVEIAASHPSVSAVLGVGYSKGETWHAIETAAPGIEKRTGKRVILRLQRRIGMNLRGGKGDGMNTALQFFVEHREFERLHFYDADITSFSGEWISKAEKQADLNFDIVRHYFPRSSTDAMITWLVTKIGFALLWPNSVLPHIEQPLGGELLLTRRAAEALVADHRVRTQSDWGIDTLYTFVTAQAGLRLAEVYVPEGKMHALYGGLRDLRTMLIECFSAVQSLKSESLNDEGNPVIHRVEFARPVPEAVRSKVGYDVEKTLKLLKEPLTPRMKDLLHQYFDPALAKGLIMATEWPTWSFCDEEAWVAAYIRFLDHFEKGDADWEELLFRVWVARVLNHTIRNVMRGYDVALGALRELVTETQQRSAGQLRAEASNPMTLASGHTALEAKQDADASWTLMQTDSDAVTAVNVPIV